MNWKALWQAIGVVVGGGMGVAGFWLGIAFYPKVLMVVVVAILAFLGVCVVYVMIDGPDKWRL